MLRHDDVVIECAHTREFDQLAVGLVANETMNITVSGLGDETQVRSSASESDATIHI
jgi:hypothetical protein